MPRPPRSAAPLALLLFCAGSADKGGAADADDTAPTADDTSIDLAPDGWDCPAQESGELPDVTVTPGAPYYIHHPTTTDDPTHTIVFLGGGPGDSGSARTMWQLFLAQGDGVEDVRVVLPYSLTGTLYDERDRVPVIVDEILTCFGGDPDHVHLAGTSNGGRGAFDLSVESPGVFATLLGAPGVFSNFDGDAAASALAGMSVYNGVGSDDTSWQVAVAETHAALVALGIDSEYAEFEGQTHVPADDWDETVLFDFWLAH